ncbi:MAG: hypothetical protein CSA20_01940 [Deltaproteobacteria bacterium]|nr:MAG: hypothetical protein CSA20_01940 [Deltaproteobacteria bacterium]
MSRQRNIPILSEQKGGVAVIVAMLMMFLLGVMAFALDSGYLYMEKNSYRNAVDIAAMAGAGALCSGDFNDIRERVQHIAEENGLDLDEGTLTVTIGYYDENKVYDNFEEYKDFIADPDNLSAENEGVSNLYGSGYQYNNAVLVEYSTEVKSLTGGLAGKDTTTVNTAAVAYLVRYGIIIEDDGYNNLTHPGNPVFHNTTLHANGDVTFSGGEAFDGEYRITATGSISNCPGTCFNVDEKVVTPPLDVVLDELKEQARNEGTYYETSSPTLGNFGDLNIYGALALIFPRPGDYGGAVFFLSDVGGQVSRLEILYHKDISPGDATSFTLATDIKDVHITHYMFVADPLNYGGKWGDTVSFYSAGTLTFYPVKNGNQCNGCFFRCEKFIYKTGVWLFPSWVVTQYLRVVADKIDFTPIDNYHALDAHFGPPCPPYIVKLGLVEEAD